MKKVPLLLILILLSGCVSYSSPTATLPPLEIRTVSGDQLPDIFPSYPTVDLTRSLQLQDIDALIISKELLYLAKENTDLRQQLQDIAWQTVLLIYGASTQDVRQILQLGSPTVKPTTTEYVLVAVRATKTQILGGGVLIPKERKSPLDVAAAIEDYVRSVQENVK